MRISVAAAVNEPETLAQCLALSPDIVSGALELRTYEGFSSAGAAYNAALDECAGVDCIIFVHQDVYLPSGTLMRLQDQLSALSSCDLDWSIAGVIGGTAAREIVGETYCSGHGKVLGNRENLPARVETLDEMLLIVRMSAGLRFDAALPSFHLYGADIILTAHRAGHSAWVIDLPAVHHSRPVIGLSGAYLSAYRYIQRKWRDELPVFNLVCPLERGLWRYGITEARLRWRYRSLKERPQATGDPIEIARKIGYEI